MQYQEPTAQQQQIKLLNELCRLQNNFKKVAKTIILYELYSTETDNLQLHNCHVVAQVLLDTSLQVQVQVIEVGYRSYFDKLNLLNQSKKIRTQRFQLDERTKGSSSLTDIVLHELEGGDLRVVVIPIQSDLTDLSKLREEQDKLQAEDKDKKKQFSTKNLQYAALTQAQAAWDKEKARKFKQSCSFAQLKHLKMFKIEAFVNTVLQKTQTYSICCLAEVNMRRQKTIALYLNEEFPKIFKVPTEVKPQFIFYNYNPKAEQSSQSQHQLVTTVMSSINNKFKVERIDCFNPQYFYKPQNVRTQIYENVVKLDNKAINKVIQDFVDSWNRITVDTASSIATVVKLANEKLMSQQNLIPQDLNSSITDLSSSIQMSNFSTFPKIFEKYISPSLWFPEKEKLKQFYTNKRLDNKIKVQKGYPRIPVSIQCLLFVHFFNKLILQFCERYRQTQINSKNDQITLLMEWKRNLKQLYELVRSINGSFLSQPQNKESYYSVDMQRLFDFLMFTFESSEKIKKITARDIATASNLKAVFEQLKPKKDRLLSFIIANEKAIRSDEPIHYYDLYLMIIKQNANSDIQNDLEYIQLHIHELKASRIASQYIFDKQKLVQAVKSYALIAEKYEKLNEKKRELIDILLIEMRMARILKILGHEEMAAQIYYKNRDLFYVDNCCKQALTKQKGTNKATFLIRWGERFQKEFQYDLANSYYSKAFSFAKSVKDKQNATSHKMKLIEKRSKLPSEEERARHDKFIKDFNLFDFCSEIKLGEMFSKLKDDLVWDNALGCSVLKKALNPEADCQKQVSKPVDGAE